MRFLPIAVVGLASVAAAAELKSWNDLLGDIPNCTKKCMNEFYKDSGLEKECGAPEKAGADCLCKPASSKIINGTMDSMDELETCLQDTCSDSELVEGAEKAQDMFKRAKDFQKQCEDSADSDSNDDSDSKGDSDSKDDADSNGAGSLLPGVSNTMLAVGAIILPAVL